MIKHLRQRLWLLMLCLVSQSGFAIDVSYEYGGHTVNYTLDTIHNTCATKSGYLSDPGNVITGDLEIPEEIEYNGKFYRVTEVGIYSFAYNNELYSVKLPSGITRINSVSFLLCPNLSKIEIGDSVTHIGSNAFGYCSSLSSISLPAKVDSIQPNTFYKCSNLTDIDIRGKVKYIGESAFNECSNLATIELGEAVSYIGSYAFDGCSSLATFSVPNQVDSIHRDTFNNCINLTDIKLPEKLKYLGNNAFYGCSSLKSIIIPARVDSIQPSTFSGCSNLTDVKLGKGVKYIGGSAFNSCTSLIDIDLGDNVTEIGASAFYGCTSLSQIVLPSTVEKIGNMAFRKCSSLTHIDLGESLTTIGSSAFVSCKSLKEIILPPSIRRVDDSAFYSTGGSAGVKAAYPANYIPNRFNDFATVIPYDAKNDVIENGFIYNRDKTALLYAPVDLNDGYIIPSSVKTIGKGAFARCRNLTGVQIPSNVTLIRDMAFSKCEKLERVVIPSSIDSLGRDIFANSPIRYAILDVKSNFAKLQEDEGLAFQDTIIRKISVREGLDISGLVSADGISDDKIVRYPDVETFIEDGTVYTADSNTILAVIPITSTYSVNSGVINVSYDSFKHCDDILELNLGSTLGNIGKNAFTGCHPELVINAIRTPAPVFDESAFDGLYETATVNVHSTVCGDYIYPRSPWLKFLNLKLDDPNSANPTVEVDGILYRIISDTEVEVAASESYKNLSEVSIPEIIRILVNEAGEEAAAEYKTLKVVGIAPVCFDGCESLTSVILPNSIVTIGDAAFRDCTSLSNVVVPESVVTIGSLAFKGCNNLTAIEGLGGVEHIRSRAFIESGLSTIMLPKIRSIETMAFDGVSTLNKAELGKQITSIGECAFRGTAVSTLALEPESELIIHAGAFMNNDVLANLTLGNGVVEIGDHAFNSCKKLTKLSIPSSVKRIGKAAFYTQNAGISTLDLPKDGALTEIADSAFAGIRVRELDLPDALTRIGDDAFASSRLISKITMPASRNLTIGRRAFSHGQRLAEVIFPETIAAIGDSCFVDNILTSLDVKADSIGAQAFVDSKKLETLNVSGGAIGEGAFRGLPELVSADINIGTIGKEAFKDSPKLKTVKLGLELKAVNDRAFLNTAVTSLTFPTSEEPEPVIVIGNQIVRALDHLSLGNRVKEITDQSVPGNEVICEGTVDLGSSIEKIGKYSISGNITSRLTLPPSLTSFCENWISVDSIFIPASDKVLQFYENGFDYVLDGINYSGHHPKCKFMYIDRPINSDYQIFNYDIDLVIGSNKSAGVELTNAMLGGEYGRVDHLYAGAALRRIERFCALTVTFDEGIETIDSLAVYELNVLRLPSSLKSLGKIRRLLHMENDGYSENSYPLEVILADSDNPLTITGEGFDKNRIESFYMGRDIESSTFSLSDSPKLENVIVGDKVTTINNNLFKNCRALKNAVMGSNVHHIGDYAFSGCTGLDILSLGESTETIGTNAYEGCTGLSRIVARATVPPAGEAGFGMDVEDNVPLFVPEESMDDYMNSDLFFAFADIQSQSDKIVEEITTDGEIDEEFSVGSQFKISDWLKFIFHLVGQAVGHNSPAKAPARAEAVTAEPAIRWFAPNPNIASVDQEGVVTINGEGHTEIWAYVLDGSDKKAVIGIGRETTLAGDVNGDGELSASDVNAIILHILLPDGNPVDIKVADLSGDGQITVSDVNNLIEKILNK